MPDLNFRIAILLKELGLPAALAKVVLSAAVQDFIDDARPTDDGDWVALSRAARSVTRERVEDYIAAATATGLLMPASGRSRSGSMSAARGGAPATILAGLAVSTFAGAHRVVEAQEASLTIAAPGEDNRVERSDAAARRGDADQRRRPV